MSRSLALALLASTALIPTGARAQSAVLPNGGTVAAGNAQIGAATPAGMTIAQSSDRAIINWRNFSIGEGQRVEVVQPDAHSVLLNRVTGDAASTIAGTLSANGHVFLVNPNGILITSTGAVNAAGFVASTLDIADRDFLDGRHDFTVTARRGAVINQGRIRIASGGYAALLGGAVANSGLIQVPLGKVAIGAAERATLDFTGDGFLQVALPGQVSGGLAIVRAEDARDAARAVVNLAAYDEATRVHGRDGTVILGGTVDVSGDGRGGSVAALGREIALGGARIDASGAIGGGSIRIGGDYQGGGTLAHADTVAADASTRLLADATRTGTGGSIILWSDGSTSFAGAISARGASGSGGDAEVSSRGLLDYRGSADLTGTRFGTLLLDPYNIRISMSSDMFQSGFTATGNDSVINTTTLTDALKTANVTVSTGTGGSQAGNITVSTALSWNSDATLTLNAAGNISFDAAVTAQAGGLTLNSGGTISGTGALSVARFTLASGNWVQKAAVLPGFASADFRITGGSFLRASGGSGTNADPYMLADVYGLQGIGSSATLLAASYRLSGDIDASLTRYWNGGAGFAPIGGGAASFSGTLDGAMHRIAGLSIARPGLDRVGLFGTTSAAASITNLEVQGAVTGRDRTGLVVGALAGTLSNVRGYGSVSGQDMTGGLVGSAEGDIQLSRAEVTVSGNDAVGGLAGRYAGYTTFKTSYASGNVTGHDQVGGLVGAIAGDVLVTKVYAAGAVSGDTAIGGLVGSLGIGTVSDAYAIGAVRGTTDVGGIVGLGGDGFLMRSYASGAVSAAGSAGGLAGRAQGLTVTNSYFDREAGGQAAGASDAAIGTGLTTAQARLASSYAGLNFAGTWFQSGDMRPIGRWEVNAADGDGRIAVDNLHQLQLIEIANNKTYYLTRDIDASPSEGTNVSGIWGGSGFRPLTSSNFDGRSHRITRLTINLPTAENVGLFASIKANYWVKDLILGNATITGGRYVGALMGTANGDASVTGVSVIGGAVKGNSGVGGMIGRSWAVLTQVTSSALVDAGIVSGHNDVGGLVGLMNGGTVTRASASGAVIGYSGVGGLVGSMTGGTVQQSFATGAVSADSYGGGLLGYMARGTLFQAYSEGAVSGRDSLGGLIGFAGNAATIRQVYTTGSVTGGSYLGGLVGYMTNAVIDQAWTSGRVTGSFRSPIAGAGSYGTVTNTYADYESSNNFTYYYDMPQMPMLTTAQARSQSSYAGFDFATDWYWADGMRPIGRWELPGAGSNGAIAITNIHQLQLMATNLAGNYRLTSDIDASATGGTTAGAGIWSSAGFNPVGKSGAAFTGTLDGLGHVITNLTINRPSTDYVGLIGNAQNLLISNMGLSGGSVTGNATVGSLAGGFVGGTIINSWSSASVSGTSQVGGLAGAVQGGISNSHATGSVTGRGAGGPVGGLVGALQGGVDNVYASGNVYAPQATYVGGLIGYTELGFNAVLRAYASGSVTGNSRVGGLAGNAQSTVFEDVYALGDVTAQSQGGGLIGYSYTSSYRRVYSAGGASGAVGGLFGALVSSSNIQSAYWDSSRNGAAAALSGTATATGLTTAQMQDASSFLPVFAGFDFNGTWLAPNAAGEAGQVAARYPTLAALDNAVVVQIAGQQVYGERPILSYNGLKAGDFVTTLGTLSGAASRGVGTYQVTSSGTTVTGNGNAYNIIALPGTLTITPRSITIAADALSRYYGEANTLTYSVGGMGLVFGDTLTGALATGADSTAGIGTYAIGQGSLAASANYAVTFIGANLTVSPRPITIAADALSRIYGEANPALGYTIGGMGLANGDALSGALTTNAGLASSVGAYAIGQGSLEAGGNYALTYVGADLTITARPITVTAGAQSRIYGEANPALSYVIGGMGLVNGDALTGALATNAGLGSNVGTYAIGQGSLEADGNYALTYVGANLTITARPITVTADAFSRIYGEANPALTYAVGGMGLVNGDALAGALATGAQRTSDVGAYAIGIGSLVAGGNYALTYVGADLKVTPRPITITADAQSRIYGEANPALSYAIGGMGLVNGDTLTGALATSAGLGSNVGIYAIGQGSLEADGNYVLRYVGADLTVTQRPITVTADWQSRIYGEANPALTYTVGGMGLANRDVLSGALATAASSASGVGIYAIRQGSLAASGNYALSYVGADLAVTARPITITGHALSRIYGESNPALTYGVGGMGLVNGDSLTGALTTNALAASGVGIYAIGQGTLAASGNYTLSYVGADLAITARPITITADALSRIYGEANPALSYAIDGMGLVNGDTLAGTLSTSATAASGVGIYAIGQGSLSASGNYALSYIGADLAIAPRPITITADALSRIYGETNPALTYAVGGLGLVNGDTLTGALATSAMTAGGVGVYAIERGTLAASDNYALSYIGANLTVTPRPITIAAVALSRIYGQANPALGYTIGDMGLANGDVLSGALVTNAGLASSVGAYAIGQGDLTASGNYALTYIGTDLIVTPRPITIAADGLSRIYGEANPALSYTIGGMGLVNGDSLTGALATSAGLGSSVGAYAISHGSLVAGGNYALTYIGADLAITARPITVIADAQSRIYGEANPALTYSVSGMGLVNGDTLTGALATSASMASGVGIHAIGQGSLAASGSYALSYVGADLAVTARPITVAANARGRIYGEVNPALTYSIGGMGLINGDALTGELTTSATVASGVGAYAIRQGNVSANSNYALSYVGGDLTIAARPITVTANALGRIYGEANPALTYSVGGMGLINGDALSGALATGATTASGIGVYAIGQGSLAASGNYALTYIGADLAITARPITITANALSRVYGEMNPTLTYSLGGMGLVNGDVVAGLLRTDAEPSSGVGIYAIGLGSLGAGSNYVLSYIGADLTITARPIIITANALSRVYGEANPALDYTIGGMGLVNGDTLTGELTSEPDMSSGIGSYAIGQGSLAASGNYTLAYTGATLTITPRPITIVPTTLSRYYGQANPVLSYLVGDMGLANGNSLTGELATLAHPASAPGSYAVTLGSLSAGANYVLRFVPGSLRVLPLPQSGLELGSSLAFTNGSWQRLLALPPLRAGDLELSIRAGMMTFETGPAPAH